MSAAALIRTARTDAGLTQAELARRMGVQQPVVARLEREGSDPRFSTIVRALEAVGQGIYVEAARRPQVDEAQIAAHLRLSPADRLRTYERDHDNMVDFLAVARKIDR
jgi:predicted transcriptional regulator